MIAALFFKTSYTYVYILPHSQISASSLAVSVRFLSASLISSYFCLSVRPFLFFLADQTAMVELEAGYMHSCSCYSYAR